MIEPGFLKASSDTLPKVDVLMIGGFLEKDERFNAAEIREGKAAINDAIMAIDHHRAIERDPRLHVGLNPLLLTMRQELHTLKTMTANARKIKLRKLLINDYLQEDKELRQVGLAYINTQK